MWKAMWRVVFQTFQSMNPSEMPAVTQIVDIGMQVGFVNQLPSSAMRRKLQAG